MHRRQRILIVDDQALYIKALNEILQDDYSINGVTSGREALETVHAQPPDIILLDIMMPGMDGYEVCRRLKNEEKTKDIPVIFITALEETTEEEKGLRIGAVDYISKPIKPPIVKARIRNHLLLKQQRDQLHKSISLMQHEAEILQQKAELGIQAGAFAHDIANLIPPLMMFEDIFDQIPDYLPHGKEIRDDINAMKERVELCIQVCHGFTSYLRNIGEEAEARSVAELLQPLDMYARQFQGRIEQNIAADVPPVKCKAYQIKRVFMNLFVNSCQAMEKNAEKKIVVRSWLDNDRVWFSIQDNGPGIPKEIQPRIFDELFTTKQEGTGLGLFLAKQIIDAHKGTIEVSSEIGKGTEFLISLPVNQEADYGD